jgi:hypothetical protein
VSAPETPAVTPGQAPYELWAQVMSTNGVDCEPFGKLGNVEQMAWREVERQPQPAPGDLLGKRFFHLASELENDAAYTPSREASGALRLAAQRIRKALDTDEQPAPELAAAMAESRACREALAEIADLTPAAGRSAIRIARRALEGK